jgi:hypothetical protein
MMICIHCGEPAMIRVHLPYGCVVFPDIHDQWLCAQHYDRLDNTHEVLQ